MSNRQIEELAKLYIDLGKFIFVSLVLGFFQKNLDRQTIIAYGLIGLIFSIGFFIMGLKLLKEIK